MTRVNFIAVICCFAMIAGCGSSETKAKDAVLEVLKDPESAKFGGFSEYEDKSRACLTVNSRNSMGGYTGNQQAKLSKLKDGGWGVTNIVEISHENCVIAMGKESDIEWFRN